MRRRNSRSGFCTSSTSADGQLLVARQDREAAFRRALSARSATGTSSSSTSQTRVLERVLVDAAAHRRVRLRVEVDQQHAALRRGERRREVDAGRRSCRPRPSGSRRDDRAHRCLATRFQHHDRAPQFQARRRPRGCSDEIRGQAAKRVLQVRGRQQQQRAAGAVRCRQICSSSAGGATARASTVSNGCSTGSPRRGRARPRCSRSVAARATTWRRKRTRLARLSISVNRRAGSAIASGTPGSPPPLPTSATRRAAQQRAQREALDQVAVDELVGAAHAREVVDVVPALSSRSTKRASAPLCATVEVEAEPAARPAATLGARDG